MLPAGASVCEAWPDPPFAAPPPEEREELAEPEELAESGEPEGVPVAAGAGALVFRAGDWEADVRSWQEVSARAETTTVVATAADRIRGCMRRWLKSAIRNRSAADERAAAPPFTPY
jgi:hypothetical protein